jgi:predicted DNA-binding transcriptional regulator AlpA
MIEQQHTYNEREAARYLGVSGAALRLWRSEGKGPRFFRAGEKLVRYRRIDLDFWIEARLSAPASSAKRTEL